MQRYRINYKWLIGFFATSLVLAVVSFFVWSWQVERKAGSFLNRAETALAEDDVLEAYRYLYQYVRLRPDDIDSRIKMANCALEVMKLEDAPIEKQQRAFQMVNQTVRVTNDPGLRRELARIPNASALNHIKTLLEADPQDAELNSLLVQRLFSAKKFDQVKKVGFDLIGYDKKSDEFKTEDAASDAEPAVYALLAEILGKRDDDPELAERVIDQMIQANPDSGEGHLHKSSFLLSQRKYEESAEFLNKAYELDPTNATILAKQGTYALSDPSYTNAKDKYLDAIDSFEKAVNEIENGVAADPKYKTAKKEYQKAIAAIATSKPTYEESKENFSNAAAEYAAMRQQLMTSLADKLERAKEAAQKDVAEASENLAAAKDNLLAAFPEPEKAMEFAAAGLKEHPDSVVFYRLMARVQHRLDQTDAALKTLDDGILDRFDENRSIPLVLYKIDLLLELENYDKITKEIERLENLRRIDLEPIIDFQTARIKYRKGEWAAASRDLKRVKPLLFNYPEYQNMAGNMLGDSFAKQGMHDLALAAFESVLKDYPSQPYAKSGKARALARLGKSGGDAVELDQIVSKTLELPEDEQDWSKVDELIEQVGSSNNLTRAQQMVIKAKILIKRSKYEEAKTLIRAASKTDPEDINVQYAAILLYMSDSSQGPSQAMKLLDRLEKKWGRSLRSILQRADILAMLGGENVGDDLRALVPMAEGLTGEQALNETAMLRLYEALGRKFEQLAKYPDAREFYQRLAGGATNSLPLRMHLFDLALKERDDEAMAKAQAGILEIVQSKSDPNYALTEARRQIIRFALGKTDREELAKQRAKLDNALQQREQWHELHVTYGQLLLVLQEDTQLALDHFDKALEYGRAKSTVVAVLVKLLAERELYDQAMERMLMLRKELRNPLLGRIHANVLMKNGKQAAALEAAEELAKAQPDNPAMQKWLADIAKQSNNLDSAIVAVRAALKANPSDADNWFRLIGFLIEQKQFDQVERVVREAHLACDPEYLPMITAKYNEMLSRWQNAEDIYLATYKGQDDNLAVSRRMADFYLMWTKKDKANLGKAAVYVNRILRAAYEGRAEADNPHVVWARQQAARILYAESDYQQSLKAERLLRDSAIDDRMNTEESSLLVDILISRDDPKSLLAAKDLLQQLRDENRLPTKGALQLARILSKTDQWDDAKTLLRDRINKAKTDSSLRATYINMLIDHDEFSQAERSLKRLQDVDGKNPALVQLAARLASEQGDQARLNAVLQSLLPKSRTTMNAEQLGQLFSVAQLASRFGAYDLAGELFTTAAKRDPNRRFDLARFHAYHGDCAVAVDLMKRLFNDRMDDVIQLAGRMIGRRRDEIGDKFDADVDRLMAQGLRDDPDSISRQLARAEAYQTQGKYEESVAAYDRILARDDLPTQLRALAMNNLGFQLGLLEQRVDEAEQMINEAIETFGPVEDMLDTRAVVRIAQGKYDLAIEDMKLALAVSRDPVKFFHLAKACALAGDGQAALQAWEMAKKNGFELTALPLQERSTFEQIRQKIESFETQSAQL